MVHDLIRLFPSDATEFESNGLGSLFEATRCIVSEESNGAFELELDYPVWGKRFNDLVCRNIIVAKSHPFSNPQAFRIYGISKAMNGIVTFNAQHISYDLSGFPVTPFTATSCIEAFEMLKSHSLKPHNFTFWTDKQTNVEIKFDTPISTRSALGGTEGSILDTYRGDYEFDNFSVKLWNNRGVNRGVTIRYGKNMTDFNQEENIANVYTSVYPYWFGTVTNEETEEDTDVLYELPERTVEVEGDYNFVNVLVQDFSSDFDQEPTEDQFREYVKAWIKEQKIGVPEVSFEVSFMQLSKSVEYKDLALLEQIQLFDTVTVEFQNLNVSAEATVNKIQYNALTDRYESISLGDIRSSISDTVISNGQSIVESEKRATNHMDAAVKNATKWITNGRGYMVAVRDEAGNWMELCSLDEPSIETAKSVWRWNNGGFGYSGTGYAGPYRTAITQDGHIVADFIDTGNLTATIITAGVLKDSTGDLFYLDLDNGILKMKPTSLFIGESNLEDSIGDINEKFEYVDQNITKMYDDAIKYANEVVGDATTSQQEELKAAIGNAMLQENIFKALTDDGKIEGLVMRDGQLYINASFIAGGVYVVGGYNDVSGVMKVRDAAGNDLITFDRRGITLSDDCMISWNNITDKSNVANKDDIPDKLSQLDNDTGYITSSDVPDLPQLPSKLSDLVNDMDFITENEIPTDEEIVDLITLNRGTIITKEYIGTLKVVAGSVAAGTILAGVSLNVGGNSNNDGVITVHDTSNNPLVTLDSRGITLADRCKISWNNITDTDEVASKEDIPKITSQLRDDVGYARASQLPTKTSDLLNDSGYITQDNIPPAPNVPTKLSQLENDMEYIAQSELPTDEEIVETIYQNRGTIITKDYIGTLKVVAGSVASGSVTSSTINGCTIRVGGSSNSDGTLVVYSSTGSALVTLNNQGITLASSCKISWSNISNTPTIPTKMSELTNDSSYAKTSQLPSKLSDLTNDKGYITSSQIPDIPTALSDLKNDMAFITDADIPSDDEIVNIIYNNRGTIITKEYIGTLKVVAGSVSAGSVTSSTITGSTISGGTIDGATITSSYGGYTCRINEGKFAISNSSDVLCFMSTGYTELEYSTMDPDSSVVYIGSNYPVFYGLNKAYISAIYKRVQLGVEGKNVNIGGTLNVWDKATFKSNVVFRYTPSGVSLAGDYGFRVTSVPTSTASKLYDVGSGITDENGECLIFIDDILYEMSNSSVEYYVFLQKEGPGDIWVEEKTQTCFTVKGTENLKFSWRIELSKIGEETARLDQNTDFDTDDTDQESELLRVYDDEVKRSDLESIVLKELETQQAIEEEVWLNE